MKIEIKILNKEFYLRKKLGGEYYDTPIYQTFGSVAIDLVCIEDVTIYPGETTAIHTGLAIYIASGIKDHHITFEEQSNEGSYDAAEWLSVAGLILPRSGLGTKGLILANTVGLIDSDYQGELIIQAWNRNSCGTYKNGQCVKDADYNNMIELTAGDRIAQLMFVPVLKPTFTTVDEFSAKTSRNTGGFGSTGL